MKSYDIAKAEEEVSSRLSSILYRRLNAALPAKQKLSREITVKLIGVYLWFAVHSQGDPDRVARAYILNTTSTLRTIKTRSGALLQSLKSFQTYKQSKLESALFDRETDLADLNELADALADIIRSCDFASDELRKRIKKKPVDRLRWAFVGQSLRIWVLTVGSLPPKTTEANKRQGAAARRNGSFADFVYLLEELVPDDCKPNFISGDFLRKAISDLQKPMEAFLKSGGQIPSRYPELDP